MSLVTYCPACGTSFHVKPEQLAPSRGDVRCGKCGQVFNALQYLAETEPESPIATFQADTVPENVVAPSVTTEEPVSPDIHDTAPLEPMAISPSRPEPEQEPVRKMVSAPAPEFKPTPVRTRSRRISLWLLIPFSLLLLLLALGQTAYFLRSEIAVRLPQTKPYLVQACAALGCTVELPRNARLLSIDDSDLQEHGEHKNVFILSSTVVNHAEYAQAYPLLELTLTDIHDRPVLRRVLAPQEYLPKGTDLKTGLPADGEVHVKLPFTADGVAATGYRVYVTYP